MRAPWELDLASDLACTTKMSQVGASLLEHVQKACPFSTLNVLPLTSYQARPDIGFQWSERHSASFLVDRMLEAGALAESEIPALGPILLSGRAKVVDLNAEFGPKGLDRTATYEHWRERKLERQMIGLVGEANEPLAMVCFVRSISEPSFTGESLRILDASCRLLAPAIERVLRPEAPWTDLETLLNLVAKSAPFEGVVFDEDGRVVWMSEDAILRYELRDWRVHRLLMLPRLPSPLQEWRTAALSALRGERSGTVRLELACGGNRSEKIEVTAYPPKGGQRGFAFVAPARVPRGPVARVEPGTSLDRVLTPTQREVARLAADGYAALNIAATTGMSPHTVRTHLKAIYKRLGVSNRAELACRMMRASREDRG